MLIECLESSLILHARELIQEIGNVSNIAKMFIIKILNLNLDSSHVRIKEGDVHDDGWRAVVHRTSTATAIVQLSPATQTWTKKKKTE